MARADAVCVLGLAGGYVASREILHRLGVRFDSIDIQVFWQALPVELLQSAPWTSVWHLHAQPPLYNALLAVALQLRDWPDDILGAVFAMAAVATLLLLFLLMRAWRVPPSLAAVMTALFAMNPSFIGYEHWPFYTMLEPLFVLSAALAATAWGTSNRQAAIWAGAGFAAASLCLVMTRALFHPVWAALAVAGVLMARAREKALSCWDVAWATVPVLLGLLLMIKTSVVAGQFATSSWLGMNASNVIFNAISREMAEGLEAQRIISPLHRVGPFRAVDRYRPYTALIESAMPGSMPTGVAVLDLERKASGQANFNHLWYSAISRIFLRDAWQVVRRSPDRVALVFGRALALFCRPTSEYGGIIRTVTTLHRVERWYRRVLYPGDSIVVIVSALLLTVAVSLRSLTASAPNGEAILSPAAAAFVVVTVLWVVVVGNLAEFGENNRFRFTIDPLLVAVTTASVATVGRRLTQPLHERAA